MSGIPPSSNAGRAASVLASLRDHPHDDTPVALAARIGLDDVADAARALEALREAGLVLTADGHWQLSRCGWRAARGTVV